jgi:N-acetylglucosamine-6-phosphate deacetylase
MRVRERGGELVSALAGRVLTPDGFRPARLEVAGGRIRAVRPIDARSAADLPRIVPGFLDLHCHGTAGVDVMGATAPGDWDRLAVGLARHGVTGYLATTVAAPLEALEAVVPPAAVSGWGAVCLGLHWEGPYLSPSFAGAQPPGALRTPAAAEIDRIRAKGSVRLITVAPELEGALDAIRRLTQAGIRVNLGHTGADYARAAQAFAAGADGVTHAYNAMLAWHHRRPNMLARALEDPSVYVEAIVDGVHLHPATVRLLFRAAPGRVLAVTDASALAGTGRVSGWLGPVAVQVHDGAAWLAHQADTLASSVLTADRGVANLLAFGLDWETAVRAWTRVPARRLGLVDRGELVVGARADLVVLTDRVEVLQTVVEGRVVYRAASA